MAPAIEKISAITFRVLNMKASVQFYRNVLGMELLYGGEQASFSSLRATDSESAILNLEQGDTVSRWGRLIFHVTDVDAFWTHLKERGFILKSHGTRPGVNAISTCSIRMATNCRLLGRCNEWGRRTRSVWRCQSIRAPVGALCLDTGYTSTIRLGKGCRLTRTWTVRPGAGLNHQFSYMSSGRSASYSRSEETLRCGKLPPEGIPITPGSNNTQVWSPSLSVGRPHARSRLL